MNQTAADWFLYQPLSTVQQCNTGDAVFFRPKSAREKGRQGVVIDQTATRDRVTVRFADNAIKSNVSLKRLVPVYKDHSIILTTRTFEYRHLAASQLLPTDSVLEIGCSTGEASVIMERYAGAWMGFDVSADMVAQCSLQVKSSRVFKMNVLVDPKGAEELVGEYLRASCVFIDIGGNRDASSAIQVISWAWHVLSPRLIVIKNKALVHECTTHCRVEQDGLLPSAHDWFTTQAAAASVRSLPDHPLQAPLVHSPVDGVTPICRYHNYHPMGCKKKSECPLDHVHCHLCRKMGHVAINCTTVNT